MRQSKSWHRPHSLSAFRVVDLCVRGAVVTSLALCALLSCLSIAEATVAHRATVESLSDQANLIVHARVSQQWTPKARGPKGEIYTYTELIPLDVWAGEVRGSLILVQLGGKLGDLHLKVHGDAQLRVGQEAVFFLKSQASAQLPISQRGLTSAEGETIEAPQVAHLVSLAQSVYYLHSTLPSGEVTLRRDLEGIVFYEPAAPHLALKRSEHDHSADSAAELWTLNRLRARVKSLISGGR